MGRDFDTNATKNAVIKANDKKKAAKEEKPPRSRTPSTSDDRGSESASPSPSSDRTQGSCSTEQTRGTVTPSSSIGDLAKRSFSFETLASYLKSTLLPTEEKAPEEEKKEKMLVRPEICRLPFSQVSRVGISLGGCGFLGSYHFGAISCFLRHGQPLIRRLDRVSGASAGSLVASLLLLAPDKVDAGLNTLYDMADELNSLKFGALTPGYFLNEKLIKLADDYLPADIDRANKRLFISVTEYKTRANVLLSEFPDRDHLLQCLMASCFIPMYSMGYAATPPYINGKYFIDGGYTNNLPDFEDVRMVTISPFSGVSADISPAESSFFSDWQMILGNQHMNVNLQNIVRGAQALFPPSRDALKQYYSRGYKDAFRFLVDQQLIERRGTAV